MIDDLPLKAVMKAALAEQRMMEEDLAKGRFPAKSLPIEHLVFYRELVTRLIDADELPLQAKRQFDATFSTDFATTLVGRGD